MSKLFDKRPYTFDRVFRLAVSLAFLVGMFWVLGYLSDVLLPFFAAFLLAYLVNPLVLWVQRWVPHRAAAIGITLTGLVVAFALLVAICVPMISNQMADMERIAAEFSGNRTLARQARDILPSPVWNDMQSILESADVQRLLRQPSLVPVLQAAAERIMPGVRSVFSGAAAVIGSIVSLAVVFLYLVFLLADFDRSVKEWEKMIPKKYRKDILRFLHDTEAAMARYFRGQAIVALGTGVLLAIGFTIIGLPLGIPLGLLIGVLAMIPYLQLVGLLPAGLLAVLGALDAGTSVSTMILLTALVFVVVQVIQDAVLTPKIMGDVTGLSPALILLSLSVWGKVLGFFGVVIAIPMTCVLLATYDRFLDSK